MRRRFLVVWVALVVPACAGSDDATPPSTSTPATTAASAAAAFRGEALATCSELIDTRDHAVWDDGAAASRRVVDLSESGTAPDAAETTALATALDRYGDALAATAARLAALTPPADLAEPWDTFVGAGAAVAEAVAGRSAAVSGWGTERPTIDPLPGDPEAVATALDTLGMLDRDCAAVFSDPGPLPGYEEFVTAAASACSEAVDRRAASGYDAASETALEALAATIGGEHLDAPDTVTAALDLLAAEWAATAAAFAAIDPATSPAPSEWQRSIDYAEQRAAVFAARSDAVATGDDAVVAAAFTIEPGLEPGLGDLVQLGLGSRDCRALD